MNYTVSTSYINVGKLCFLTWKARVSESKIESEGFKKIFWRFYIRNRDFKKKFSEESKDCKRLIVRYCDGLIGYMKSQTELEFFFGLILYKSRRGDLVTLIDRSELPMMLDLVKSIEDKAFFAEMIKTDDFKEYYIKFVPMKLVAYANLVIDSDGYVYKNRFGGQDLYNEILLESIKSFLDSQIRIQEHY